MNETKKVETYTNHFSIQNEVKSEPPKKSSRVFKTATSFGWIDNTNPFFEKLKSKAVAWATIIEDDE